MLRSPANRTVFAPDFAHRRSSQEPLLYRGPLLANVACRRTLAGELLWFSLDAHQVRWAEAVVLPSHPGSYPSNAEGRGGCR
jgi:hypothetical protein